MNGMDSVMILLVLSLGSFEIKLEKFMTCGYMGMWHTTQKPILLIGLSLKGITQHGGGQGDTHPPTELMAVASQCFLL